MPRFSIAFFVILLSLSLSRCFVRDGESSPNSPLVAVDIGTLTPFYRATQLQGHIPGQGLMPIPDYLLGRDVDLNYLRNPRLLLEVPFADSFTITRFLGGYKSDWLKRYGNWNSTLGNESFDYVFRGPDTSFSYSLENIERHLKPYLQAGYSLSDLTLSIENTPWAIARNSGEEGAFGQTQPPENWIQWRTVTEHFATDIKTLYGGLPAPNFKIGNEYDTRKSFDGTARDYYDYYSIAFDVLRAAFPKSEIAPGEFTRDGTCVISAACVYDTKSFLEEMRSVGRLPDYVPRSLYAIQGEPTSSASATVERAVASYRRLGEVIPEIHQFGLLGQPFGDFPEFGSDSGARAAAWEFIVLMGLQEKLHPRRVFHWDTFVTIDGSSIALLNGSGFLRMILDHYLGAQMSRLPVTVSGQGTEVAAVRFRSDHINAIVIASSTLASDPVRVNVQIDSGASYFPSKFGSLRAIRYSEENNVFLQIKSDLAADSNLRTNFKLCNYCVSDPRVLAQNQQKLRKLLVANQATYNNLIRDSLRFHNVRNDEKIHTLAGNTTLEVQMSGNEFLVLDSN